MQEKFAFIYSNRFWALVAGAVVFYLKTKNFIGESEMILIETILGGFWATKTIDRATEKLGGE